MQEMVEQVQMQLGIERSEELQGKMWSKAIAIAKTQPAPISIFLLQSLNDVIDLHEERVTAAFRHRMPNIFWGSLYGLTVLSMIVGGYDAGLTGGRRSVTTFLAPALAFSIVLLLVIALDRPQEQFSKVGQAAMIDLQHSIHRTMKNP